MSLRGSHALSRQVGVGLMEVMVSIVIGMLLVLVIYQVYELSEGQKRTITAGSDAQQNASYGMYVIGRDISMAGNGIASTAVALDPCALLRPIPVLIEQGATKVFATATHPVLSGPAVDRIEKSHLEEVVCTNTIPLHSDARKCKKIRILSVGKLLAQAVESIHDETSVSVLFI